MRPFSTRMQYWYWCEACTSSNCHRMLMTNAYRLYTGGHQKLFTRIQPIWASREIAYGLYTGNLGCSDSLMGYLVLSFWQICWFWSSLRIEFQERWHQWYSWILDSTAQHQPLDPYEWISAIQVNISVQVGQRFVHHGLHWWAMALSFWQICWFWSGWSSSVLEFQERWYQWVINPW